MLPEEVLKKIPRWRRMGYEPHVVLAPSDEGGSPVIFRTLTKKEYSEVVDSPLYRETEEAQFLGTLYTEPYQEIIELALLWPIPLPDHLAAAADKIIAEAIVEASAWVSTEKLASGLVDARDRATSLDGFLKSRIIAAFPAMTLEQVDEMTFSEMMGHIAMSEVVTGVPVDIQPWVDPEGYQKKIDRMNRMNKRIQQEREAGMNVDPRMKDPEFRQRLIDQAQKARTRLHDRPSEDLDFDKMNAKLIRAKNG